MDWLQEESDPIIIKMGELADSINEQTEKLKRMDNHGNNGNTSIKN